MNDGRPLVGIDVGSSKVSVVVGTEEERPVDVDELLRIGRIGIRAVVGGEGSGGDVLRNERLTVLQRRELLLGEFFDALPGLSAHPVHFAVVSATLPGCLYGRRNKVLLLLKHKPFHTPPP